MSSTQLRQYIDILKEDDFSTFSNFGFGPDTTAPTTKSPKTDPAAASKPATTPKSTADAEPAAETPTEKGQPADDATAIQQALVDAGFELPRFGVDGKIGPETRAAIKAAEMVMGRKPTGTITVKEIEVIKNKGAAADNNSLASALGAIEAVLAKYKIKTESIEEQIDAYILKNINEYSQQEQLEIWRTLTEAEDIYVPPNSGGQVRDDGTQARMQMARNPNPAISRANDPFGLIGRSETSPAPKQSKLAKFAGKLGGAKGIGKKLVGRAAATALSGPAALAVGTGLAAWTAYDIGKALYDTFASTEIADLDPADQKIITDNLKTVMAYEQDPKMLATLPNELQLRVSNVAKGLNSLAVDVGAVTPPSTKTAEKTPAPQSTSKSEPTVTTKNEYRIANELVVPGQPLSQKQMAVIKMSMDMGNSYPPEVMAQYNKQKSSI
jgi:peptidoglycan hydrolase-like protein with peptidoglycan-binding domain